ncbi:IstB ATP binding domain-containing protein, partial [mine drainage metagenome]
MLNNQTIEGLELLKLNAMASGLIEQRQSAQYQALQFEERLGMLVDREITERDNRRQKRQLRYAKLRHDAVVEDIDFRQHRGLERSQVLSLAEGSWISHHHNVSVLGPTGVGKTYIACALAHAGI